VKALLLGSASYKSSLTYFRLVATGRQLIRHGWSATMIVPSADKYNHFIPDKNASLDPIKLIQPWQLLTKSAVINLVPYLFTSLVHILRNRADVIYLYKPTPITILGLLPKLLFRTPVILDLDDLGSEVMRLQGQSNIQVKLVAACENLALRYASAVVVASSYLQQIVQERYPHKPVHIMSNGVDPGEFTLAKVSAPRNHVYYFGAINRLSLIEELLRAVPATLAAVPDTQVTIMGGGSALDEAKALVRDLRIDQSVTFTGWIDMLDAQQYTQFADIAICCQPDIPTVRAASNLKVFQYMAMGSVPVVSDVGDLKSYVQDGKAGVAVPAGDPKKLAQALIALLQDTALRTKLATSARRQAETTYAWDTLGTGLDQFVTGILKQPVRQPKGVEHV
jgi:glycosyltransferase involved in cell wall biosynthesis